MDSNNAAAVGLQQQVGTGAVLRLASNAGLSNLPDVPSLALGTGVVSPLELATAYTMFPGGGEIAEPRALLSVTDAQGEEVFSEQPRKRRVLTEPAAFQMLSMLRDVVDRGTGTQARALGVRGPVGGKTGTTDEYRDAWFVGFTSDIVVGVWVGNDDNKPMDQVTGGDVPARIWHDFVTEAEHILKHPAAAPPPALTGSSAEPAVAGAPAKTAVPPAAPVQAPAPAPQQLRGVPQIVDTATLRLNGAVIRLDGIAGETGKPAQDLGQYIRGREIACQPADTAGQYRCTLGDYDLGEAVLLNGAGRAAADAPERMRQAEQQARLAGRGVWAR